MDDTQVEAVTDTQEDSAPHEVLPSEKDKEYVQDLFKNNVEIESPLTQPETDPVTAVQQDVQSIEEDKEMPLESEKDSVPIEPQELNTVVCEQMEAQSRTEIPELFLTKEIAVIEAGVSYQSVSPPVDHELASEESTKITTETVSETDVSKTKQKKKTRKHRKTSKDKDLGKRKYPLTSKKNLILLKQK
ncbi:hypothetical protein WMY93_027572 [Mugilogobius chulae]|uniref:Uncharacterized protein n=1 Tax=Mugilogobius chulae TaxID=88201 RepID=A0AAW0N5M1_9GOBI